MKRLIEKAKRRERRKTHIRKRLKGTSERPRMSVFRSNKHIYVQVVDDVAGNTVAAASSLEKEYRSLKLNVASAAKIGEVIGERLKGKNIQEIVFDRNGYLYHGIVKAVADGARKAGIRF